MRLHYFGIKYRTSIPGVFIFFKIWAPSRNRFFRGKATWGKIFSVNKYRKKLFTLISASEFGKQNFQGEVEEYSHLYPGCYKPVNEWSFNLTCINAGTIISCSCNSFREIDRRTWFNNSPVESTSDEWVDRQLSCNYPWSYYNAKEFIQFKISRAQLWFTRLVYDWYDCRHSLQYLCYSCRIKSLIKGCWISGMEMQNKHGV